MENCLIKDIKMSSQFKKSKQGDTSCLYNGHKQMPDDHKDSQNSSKDRKTPEKKQK